MSKEENKRFNKVSFDKKQEIWNKRKAKNTNDSTRLWVNCFKEYLTENALPEIDLISNFRGMGNPSHDILMVSDAFRKKCFFLRCSNFLS